MLWDNLLWNHFYSSVFMDSQNFLGSSGPNSVGSVIGIILINIKQILVYMFIGKGYSQNQ